MPAASWESEARRAANCRPSGSPTHPPLRAQLARPLSRTASGGNRSRGSTNCGSCGAIVSSSRTYAGVIMGRV
eukprot:4496551-Heterocapsa_arctica.AAC.1